jgi:hypothetical protein
MAPISEESINNDTKMLHIYIYALIYYYSTHIASSENYTCKVNNKLAHSTTSIKTHDSGATGRSYQVKLLESLR